MSGSAATSLSLLGACNNHARLMTGSDSPTPTPNPGELALPLGPLSQVGPLVDSGLDGIAIPQGFSLRAVARAGTPATLGSLYPWHAFPDGGACFTRDDGGWIYTSNSEVPGGAGGCGALAFDANGNVVDAYPILSNTSSNCAGGATPWNSWLSCEETASGLVWETDPYGVIGAVAKPALGLFSHEAAAVDLAHRTVYLTEDSGDGRFYRWVADASDHSGFEPRLALENGRLQVLNLDGLENGGYADDPAAVRQLRAARWVDAIRPDEPQGSVRDELAATGEPAPGTRFAGGEGLWFHELPAALRSVPPAGHRPTRGVVFWTTKGDNRVWALDIENQLVELIFDNEQITPGFSDVDNLTVSPAGDILVSEDLTESGRGIRIMVVVPNQPAVVLVDCYHPGSEICGPAFSPDGSRLYFSSQRGPAAPMPTPELLEGLPGTGLGATYELLIPEAFRA